MWSCVRRLASVAVLFSAALPIAWALFEDEVGQYEWMVQQIGQPVALAYSADAADKVFVASASGVLASILLKDGSLHWRRVAANSGSTRLLRVGSRGLLSVTDRGLVQAWKGSTGDLTWQREYPDYVIDLHVVGTAARQNVVVVRESEIDVRTSAGKHEWSVAAGANGARFWAAAPGVGESMVCAISSRPGGTSAQSMQIDIATGKVVKTTEVPASVAKALETSDFIVVDTSLVSLTSGVITSQSLCGDGPAETFELKKVKSSDPTPFKLMPWQRTSGVLSVTNGVTTGIFGLGSKGLRLLRTMDGVAVVGPVHSAHEDETGQPVAVAIVGSEGTKIQLLDPASGNAQPAIVAKGYTSIDHGPARLLLMRELSSGEHRTLISAADHSLASVQGSEVSWVREEALASVKQAVFHGRAASFTEAKEDAGMAAAIGSQLSSLPALFGELAEKPAQLQAAVSGYIASLGREPKRTKPTLLPNGKAPTSAEELRSFGANKLILCLTAASKVFALEATTSEILWQRYFSTGAELLGDVTGECRDKDSGVGDKGRCGLWMQALPSASAAYSEVVVVMPMPAGASQIHWVDPLTGKDLHSQAAPTSAAIVSLMALPQGKTEELHPIQPFLMIDTTKKVHALPSKDAKYAAIMEAHAGKFFHYQVNRETQVVQGFAIGKSSGSELMRLWNIELGSNGERIVAAATPENGDWDHVPVHIKGDASILYKYINANMIAVAAEGVDSKNQSSLSLYSIDSVTGRVLHQSRIPGGAAPATLALCDNWLLMHYWNSKRTRFELTVVELFEAKQDDGPWNILFGDKQGGSRSTSAHHLETPVPLQQTYIFPQGVTSMGITATLKGITPRSVILALTTDHLLSISKDVLNPRRPYMTKAGVVDKDKAIPSQFAATKEEPLMPYNPIMPLKQTDVLTYHNPVGQVRGIVSSPTALESTSIVFSFGLDLFFTPVQTAKAYDVLSPGFNYQLLYVTCGGLFVALLVSSYYSSYKALQDRWK